MADTSPIESREGGEALCPVKKTSIGGQALIEGVMMRGPERTAMAVRHVSGEIVEESWPTTGQNRPAIWKVPFFRGIYGLVDSAMVGQYQGPEGTAALSRTEPPMPVSSPRL